MCLGRNCTAEAGIIMKIKVCSITNFGSYKDLNFDFQNSGLSLIYGTTGSGKSTVMDAVCWIAFGKTSKGGSVDSVRRWDSGKDTTEGYLIIDTLGGEVSINRIRGKGTVNDLYFTIDRGDDNITVVRGRDLHDTQLLLNQVLGMDYTQYIDTAYFSEFSAARSFFVDKPSKQKDLFIKLVNLSTPIKLRESVVKDRKDNSVALSSYESKVQTLKGSLQSTGEMYKHLAEQENTWISDLEYRLHNASQQSKTFEDGKHKKLKLLNEEYVKFETHLFGKIKDLEEEIFKLATIVANCKNSTNLLPCVTCGVVNSSLVNKHELHQERLYRASIDLVVLKNHVNPFLEKIQDVESSVNTHDDLLETLLKEQNPYTSTRQSLDDKFNNINTQLELVLNDLSTTRHRENALNTLYNLCLDLEGILLQRCVNSIQDQINYFMESCFDSMIKVDLSMGASDDLTVTLQKNGYECTYKQLSKGQRGILNLCLGVSIMKASANQIGIHSHTLFFDEALDGLDSDLKVKAFSLFSLLNIDHESIFLIDHELALQDLFTNKFKVTMSQDISDIRLDDV